MFRELFNKFKEYDYAVYEEVKQAFEACQNAGIIHDGTRSQFNKIHEPATGYDYFEFSDDHTVGCIHVEGRQYSGGGEYDYVAINIPIDAFDTLDEWIAKQKKIIEDKFRDEAAQKAAENKKREEERERYERTLYETLKKKFMDEEKRRQ